MLYILVLVFVSYGPFVNGFKGSAFGWNTRRSVQLNGVPRLYRWISETFPETIADVDRGFELDNFFIDMNGIVHSCIRNSMSGGISFNEDVMMKRICSYVDLLCKVVKPKNMVYLAIDGVAPAAKMQQQRSRRYKSASERNVGLANFDANAITPGTAFMENLYNSISDWIVKSMTRDPFWSRSGLRVVLSSANVVGEGEHKIMDFIRKSRTQNYYPTKEVSKSDQNRFKNCIHGLDADLILLALASCESSTMILREKTSSMRRDPLSLNADSLEYVDIGLLRENLHSHICPSGSSGEHKLTPQQIVDDFVFM